jgi:DNA-binding NarL/FixJ family response regulator
MTGLQAAADIAKTHPRLPMLLISVQEVSTQLALEARRLGFSGAVTRSSGAEVVEGIEALIGCLFSNNASFSTRHRVASQSSGGIGCASSSLAVSLIGLNPPCERS